MAVLSILRFIAIMASMYPLVGAMSGGSIADIEHVVLFMQENRAFDHYFGTMAGVRGFSDPNVQTNSETPVWQQPVNASTYLNPWYLNYLGGDWLNATQCMSAGSNGWTENQLAYDHGLNDHWAANNTPWSWGHFKRSDIPVQFAIAEGWTVGDMYQESVIAATNPNRVTWVSGTINVPGSPQSPSEGGYPYIDNNETPGCDSDGINCYPLRWETAAEIYERAGVSWQVYQDADNFDDNPLAWFAQFQNAPQSSSLHKRGFQGLSLDTFYAQAANGTLPEISYIIGPTELSEHPPYSPRDGAWLQKTVVDAVTSSPKYAKTVLIISWDETGGFGDHVSPYHSPPGTPGEWLKDPYAGQGEVFSGPGFRLPFYIISPWTRSTCSGGTVFTEHADHNSQILFVEKWQAAKGRNVTTDQMVPWRRAHMSDLTAAFDFSGPDYSIPSLPYAIPPHTNAAGVYDGSAHCDALYPTQRPPVPYNGQTPGSVKDAASDVSSFSEEGFKEVRGQLTEGRYLVLEWGGQALVNLGVGSSAVASARATRTHSDKNQRWAAHVNELGGNRFRFSSALDGRWITDDAGLTADASKAGSFAVVFAPGKGYGLQGSASGKWLAVPADGKIGWNSNPAHWQIFSVTYHN
ncbi:putative phospholipase [Diplogelasinospora grovesii]|uniref:Phospholipase n=1 Tax=Diplogelasinospora grovesii TaxID=303347 RepID=A0AAN6N6S0_9PEZI|nr:putative phospholipase [Diplogelasinospora grovesii]